MQIKYKSQLTKGDKIVVKGNSIAEIMGFGTLTGEIFLVNPYNETVTIKCDQTGALECVDIGDGEMIKN